MRLHYLTSHSKNGQLEFVVKVNQNQKIIINVRGNFSMFTF